MISRSSWRIVESIWDNSHPPAPITGFRHLPTHLLGQQVCLSKHSLVSCQEKNLVIVCLVIQEGLPTPATGWQPKCSYTFKIPSRKEHIGTALSYLVSVVTWDLLTPVSAPSSSEAALSTSLLCTVALSTGCQCWQNSQCRHSSFQIDCASHTHLQGCTTAAALRQHEADSITLTESFFICSADTAFVLPRGSF